MAIQMRRGSKAGLDKGRLVDGEIAVCVDAKEVFISFGSNDSKEVFFKEDFSELDDKINQMIDAKLEVIENGSY